MNCKKIELYGFKSFADKTVITIKDGLTAIVGPNGSGKSNIADALRWVLGEQSAKTLRGKNMQDVIFQGTDTRKKLSYCEVNLYFSNADEVDDPADISEIIVSRRLDRSGNSEYFLNNEKARLKDIINLLHDIGISTDGYAIIGQDKAKDIVTNKPLDRRIVFEEAAGVSKFKGQKKETERKLERTQENLNHYAAILNEMENRLEPLRKQADTAIKYNELSNELKHHEVNYYIYQYENNKSVTDAITAKLNKVTAELELAEKEEAEARETYDVKRLEIDQVDVKIMAINSQLTALKINQASVSGDAKLHADRAVRLSEEIQQLEKQKEMASLDLDARAVELENAVKNKAGKEEILKNLEAELKECLEAQERINLKISDDENSLENSNRRILEASEELANIKGNLSALLAEKEIHQGRLVNLKESLSVKKAAQDAEIRDKAIFQGQLSEIRQKGSALTQKYNSMVRELEETKNSGQSLQEDLVKANARVSSFEAKVNLLIEQKKSYDGFQLSVKRLMQDAQSRPDIQNRILGVVGEIIKAKDGLETAIETALGGALQNVVTADEEDTKQIIYYLQSKNMGQVTFLPLTSFKVRRLEPEYEKALTEPGCYGLACDLVSYDSRFDTIIKGLLGKTVVVNNLDTAIRMAKQYRYGFKIVTLDGHQTATSGAVRGGSVARGEGVSLLAKEKEIENNKRLLESAKKQVEQLTKMRDEAQSAVVELDKRIKECDGEINECSIKLNVTQEKLKKCNETIDNLDAEVKTLADEIRSIESSIKDTDVKVRSIDELESEISEKKQFSGELIEKAKLESDQNKREKELNSRREMTLKVEIASAKSEIEQTDNEIFRLKRECSKLQEDIMDLEARLKTDNAALDIAKQATDKAKLTAEDSRMIDELEAELEKAQEFKRTTQEEVTALDRKKLELGDKIRILENRKYNEQTALERNDSNIKYLQEHIWEEYTLTYQNALELKEEGYEADKAPANINRIKRAINQLGAVNHHAVEDFEDLNARYNETKEVYNDLEQAKADLEKIISELVNEIDGKFTEAFNKINDNFAVTFKQLFGGGEAKLMLVKSETEDPLDAGVEIYAQPPGKKARLLSQLSGGEQALTSIAILFAILQFKAMPFCLLDEVEAALDDSNAALFAEYLGQLSGGTQFIVITHRKPTMEAADHIFGVTTEERGVSKIISIELSEAQKHAQGDD